MKRWHPTVLTRLWSTDHKGRQLMTSHSYGHDLTVQKIHQVAARLHGRAPDTREGQTGKQETPGSDSPEVSTAPISTAIDGRAASAQSDTNQRQ